MSLRPEQITADQMLLGFNNSAQRQARDVNLLQSINEITSPDNYLGREHFRSFTFITSFTLRQAFSYFNACIIAATHRPVDKTHRFTVPADLNLIVKRREEAGLKITRIDQRMTGNRTILGRELGGYAIEAGSIVAAKQHFEVNAHKHDGSDCSGNIYLGALARRLERQFLC